MIHPATDQSPSSLEGCFNLSKFSNILKVCVYCSRMSFKTPVIIEAKMYLALRVYQTYCTEHFLLNAHNCFVWVLLLLDYSWESWGKMSVYNTHSRKHHQKLNPGILRSGALLLSPCWASVFPLTIAGPKYCFMKFLFRLRQYVNVYTKSLTKNVISHCG